MTAGSPYSAIQTLENTTISGSCKDPADQPGVPTPGNSIVNQPQPCRQLCHSYTVPPVRHRMPELWRTSHCGREASKDGTVHRGPGCRGASPRWAVYRFKERRQVLKLRTLDALRLCSRVLGRRLNSEDLVHHLEHGGEIGPGRAGDEAVEADPDELVFSRGGAFFLYARVRGQAAWERRRERVPRGRPAAPCRGSNDDARAQQAHR